MCEGGHDAEASRHEKRDRRTNGAWIQLDHHFQNDMMSSFQTSLLRGSSKQAPLNPFFRSSNRLFSAALSRVLAGVSHERNSRSTLPSLTISARPANVNSPDQNSSFIANWMVRGVVTLPFHWPNVGLAISMSNAVEPKQRVSQLKLCQFQALKASIRNWSPIFSEILVFLMMLMSWFW